MKLKTTLTTQQFQNTVREIMNINPNYCYPFPWTNHLLSNTIVSVTIEQRKINVDKDYVSELYA